MKWIRIYFFTVLFITLFTSACNPKINRNSIQEINPTITQTSTSTPVPSLTPTLIPTITPTPIPPLVRLMNEAKYKEMFVVLLFTPNAIVEEYFNDVETIQGFSAADLLKPINPDLYQQISITNYYPDYFKVIMVGNPECEGRCVQFAENGYCDNLYCNKLLYNGEGIMRLNYYYYGVYLVYWQTAENRMCTYDPAYTWCITAK